MTPRIPDSPRVGVAGILTDGAGRVLLVRRAHPPHVGSWAFPGGRVRWGEPLGAALVRELREECGLTVVPGPLLYATDLIGPDFHLVVLDYGCRAAPGPVVPGDDAADARWCTRTAVWDLPLAPAMADALGDGRVEAFLGWA
jgi:8-oxo-dGTP diphosphatase